VFGAWATYVAILFSANVVGAASFGFGSVLSISRYARQKHRFWSRTTSAHFVDGAAVYPLLITAAATFLPESFDSRKLQSLAELKHIIAVACIAAIFAIMDDGEGNGAKGADGHMDISSHSDLREHKPPAQKH